MPGVETREGVALGRIPKIEGIGVLIGQEGKNVWHYFALAWRTSDVGPNSARTLG